MLLFLPAKFTEKCKLEKTGIVIGIHVLELVIVHINKFNIPKKFENMIF